MTDAERAQFLTGIAAKLDVAVMSRILDGTKPEGWLHEEVRALVAEVDADGLKGLDAIVAVVALAMRRQGNEIVSTLQGRAEAYARTALETAPTERPADVPEPATG